MLAHDHSLKDPSKDTEIEKLCSENSAKMFWRRCCCAADNYCLGTPGKCSASLQASLPLPPCLFTWCWVPAPCKTVSPWLSDSVATHSPTTSYGNRGHLKALTLSLPWWRGHASLYPPDPAEHNRESGPLASSLPPPVHVPIVEDLGFQVASFPPSRLPQTVMALLTFTKPTFSKHYVP